MILIWISHGAAAFRLVEVKRLFYSLAGGDVSGSCVSMVCKLEIAHDVLLTGLRFIVRGGVLLWD
jgi:hypothetical protein